MKRSYRIAGKVVISGLIGIGLFVASLFVIPLLVPRSDHPDVVEGWTIAFFLIIAMFLSITLSGVISVLLNFNDIARLKEAIAVSFFSGVVTTIVPLLFGAVIGLVPYGGIIRPQLFGLCLIVVLACDVLATTGGVLIFLPMSYLRKRKLKQQMTGQS